MAHPTHHRALALLLVVALSAAAARRPVTPAHTMASARSLNETPRDAGARAQLLDLNRATETELTTLPGVGPVMARRIVGERARRGGFRSVRELDDVRGIGPALLDRLTSRVTIGSEIQGPAGPDAHVHEVGEPVVEPAR
jgi:competence protein ComEA